MTKLLSFAPFIFAIALCGALASGLAGQSIPVDAHKVKNPFSDKDKTAVLAGAAVYRAQCAGCHGPDGTPVRKFPRLKVQPAVLTSRETKKLSDGDMFWILSHGLDGGMPSFDDLLEKDRWQTVAFVRHLGKDAAGYTAQLPEAK